MSEESDDAPPGPKRKIREVITFTSDSDSEEDVGVAESRRKKLRILSDEDGNESSGSSVICLGSRRGRMLPKLKDSEVESDGAARATGPAGAAQPSASTSKPKPTTSGFTSDSSEDNSEKCSICLLRFTTQEVGTPESCEHVFCLDCIMEWSKNVNTCPVDRKRFKSIVVKACAGGRVLRTQPLLPTRRNIPSVDLLVVEDETVCEICGSGEGGETMLLCDNCDFGFHMQCLEPPLTEVPREQWLCPNCFTDNFDSTLVQDISLSDMEDTFGLDTEEPLGLPLRSQTRSRVVRIGPRYVNIYDPEPAPGQANSGADTNVPTTSRGSRGMQRNTSHSTPRRRTTTKRRKYKRRRTKTVVIEYEVQENGKFPKTKKVTKKVKKRRVKTRQARTLARRSHVRASVRARLAALDAPPRRSAAPPAAGAARALAVHRQRAGILPLSLLGNPNDLEYFSEEDDAISEEASTAVALRSTTNIFNAYRQARRKMIMLPSPPHAAAAPDILSNILESQTLLHSKNSVLSISVDGDVKIKLQTERHKKNDTGTKKEEKIDVTKTNAAVKTVPSYPGQNRGGGWGGGYRGNYHREQNSNNFNRSNSYESGYSGNYQNRQGNSYNYQNNSNSNMRREDTEYYDNFPRRPQQYSHNDDSYFDRARRTAPDSNRGTGTVFSNHQRTSDQSQTRYSLGPSWQPYNSGGASVPRQDVLPPAPSRHSFGGFENPVDMRMGQMPPISRNADTFSGIDAPLQEKTQSQTYQSLPEPQAYQPLSEPPVFNFPKISEVEKSEDEKSDSGLVIDTEKYDPTEPTHDDDSGEDDIPEEAVVSTSQRIDPVAAPASAAAARAPSPPPVLQDILAGIDTSTMNVPPNILDTAVRQVLQEHRNLIVPPIVESHNDRSDDESDGDCPNFSIYSATSVHIANNSGSLTDEVPKEQAEDSLEDLVQEDDETPPSVPLMVQDSEIRSSGDKPPTKSHYASSDYDEKKKSEEEYKEKVSKRCPITTNKRNPIKIKLNTPSLIKRQVTLYDEEETSQDVEFGEKTEPTPVAEEDKSVAHDQSLKKDVPEKNERDIKTINVVNKCDEKILNPIKQNFNDDNHDDLNEKNVSQCQVEEKVQSENNIQDLLQNNEKKVNCEVEEENNNENLESNKTDGEGSDHDNVDNMSDQELGSDAQLATSDRDAEKVDDNVEKMTESISETEDERSYTPCLDENKSNKDASFETEKDKGIEGLDTEMISEDEGNEMFSENERAPSETFRASPAATPANEDGEIPEKKKELKKPGEGGKKKKKKDSKKDGKEKTKGKKKGEISFKKLSKSGKERNYRERDKDDKKTERERRDSGDAAATRQRRRKEKRKDLERYDVRTVVTEKRRKQKDPFGRDVSPRGRSPSLSPPLRSPSRARRSPSPARRTPSRGRRSLSRGRRSISRNRRSPSRNRRSLSRNRSSPARARRSTSRIRRSLSGFRRSPSRARRSLSRGHRSLSRARRSPSLQRRSSSRGRRSPPGRKSPGRRGSPPGGRSPSPPRPRRSPARRARSASTARRRSGTPQASPRRRSVTRRKRRRSASRAARSPPRRAPKKKKRVRPERRAPPPSPERKRRRSPSRPAEPEPPSPAARPPSPRTPPPEPEPERRERRRRDPERQRRRGRDLGGPSKEVFTSGDNILVSVSFKEQERGEEGERRRRRESRRERRRRRRAAAAPDDSVKPVAIIDLERSPFRELTPSPKNVIVLSDSEPGEREGGEAAPGPAAPEPAPEPAPALGPKTPPEPAAPPPAASPRPADALPGAAAAPSPDAYDPFEPTRSPSASPARASPRPPSPPRTLMTLEAAQRSNLSADEVLDRRPLTPVEKVMALLQSTRDAEAEAEAPEPPPAPRIVLPSPTRAPPKLFPGKPSPIKSNPVKPMQAARLARAADEGGASPYSPGSSDFGELFEPPPRRARQPARVPVRLDRRRGRTQVGIKIDDDNLKILDELPSSAVELQVKSKFLKKLNRQERVVEEVKLVLKPHYNKKRITKEEYKDILRRAVPKICHNKSGEINPTKIQALVEAYVRKFRKKHKLGVM